MKYNVNLLRTLPLLILSQIIISGEKVRAGVCPAVGADTNCGTIITITNSGAYPSSTGQGPYDGDDDTLVGVVNNSNLPISTLALTGDGIFGFDGDGITTYGAPGNAKDPTGYGGSNAFYTNIISSISGITSGDVNFITPIAPGETGYFSLESNLSLSPSCEQVIDNSVMPSVGVTHDDPNRPAIKATFKSNTNLNFSLSQAAVACGFKNFNWEQKINVLPDPVESSLTAVNPSDPKHPIILTSKSTPYNDPYQNGYTYNPAWNSYPFYYEVQTTDKPWSLSRNEPDGIDGNILSFYDSPSDACLPGNQSPAQANYADMQCGGKGIRAPIGSEIGFTTYLVGVLPDNSLQPLGISFSWTDSYNGSTGGISILSNYPSNDDDPGSGTGSITITGETNTTTYNYVGGLTINTINGIPNGPTYFNNITTVQESPPVNLLTLGFLGIWLTLKKFHLIG